MSRIVSVNAWRVLVALLLAATVIFAGSNSLASAQSEADDPAEVAAGRVIYESNCAGCHGAEGEGSNSGRPLTGIADQGDRASHIASIVNGKGNMPAFGERLSEGEIGEVASFVRLSFVAQDEPELAVTGYNSSLLALVGMSLALGGGALIFLSQRREATKSS